MQSQAWENRKRLISAAGLWIAAALGVAFLTVSFLTLTNRIHVLNFLSDNDVGNTGLIPEIAFAAVTLIVSSLFLVSVALKKPVSFWFGLFAALLTLAGGLLPPITVEHAGRSFHDAYHTPVNWAYLILAAFLLIWAAYSLNVLRKQRRHS